MSLAPQELENTASKYASEAIKFDSQGSTWHGNIALSTSN